jgi:hypothetical protein
MNISATITITSAIETALRNRQAGLQAPTPASLNTCQREAPYAGGHHPLLARVDHPVRAVEEHDQQRAEGGDRHLVDIGHAEDHQEQRDQRRRGRGAEEVDQEFDAAVGALVAAEQHAQRHADRRGDQEGLRRTPHHVREVEQMPPNERRPGSAA